MDALGNLVEENVWNCPRELVTFLFSLEVIGWLELIITIPVRVGRKSPATSQSYYKLDCFHSFYSTSFGTLLVKVT